MKLPEQTTLQDLGSLILENAKDSEGEFNLKKFFELVDESEKAYGLSEEDINFLYDIVSLEEQTNAATRKNTAEAQKIINKLKNK